MNAFFNLIYLYVTLYNLLSYIEIKNFSFFHSKIIIFASTILLQIIFHSVIKLTKKQKLTKNIKKIWDISFTTSLLVLLGNLIFEDISTLIQVSEVDKLKELSKVEKLTEFAEVKKLTEFAEVKKLTESAELVNFTTEFINYINKLNQTTDLKKVKVLFMIVPFILIKISKCFLKSYQY